MDLNLRGRTALITGASKGIGRAIAAVLAQEGCNLILVSRTAADLEATRNEIAASHNVVVVTHALDLSASTAINELATAHPDIDILVNNAGAIPGGRLSEIDDMRWRQSWDLKVFGYINMTRAFYETMKARNARGHHQHTGRGGRAAGGHLYRGLNRQRRLDRLHEILGCGFSGRQYPCGRGEPRTDRDRAA